MRNVRVWILGILIALVVVPVAIYWNAGEENPMPATRNSRFVGEWSTLFLGTDPPIRVRLHEDGTGELFMDFDDDQNIRSIEWGADDRKFCLVWFGKHGETFYELSSYEVIADGQVIAFGGYQGFLSYGRRITMRRNDQEPLYTSADFVRYDPDSEHVP